MNFVCVYYGDKYIFKYVEVLYNMVKRNLTLPHKFICFTDSTVIHRRKEFKTKDIEWRQFKRHDLKVGLISYNCLVLIVNLKAILYIWI